MYKILLCVHILAGAVNLLTGLLVMIMKKGNRRHRQSGRVFFYTMMAVAATALAITFLRPNTMLASIGIFSGYMALSGFIVIRKDFERRKYWLWPAIAGGLIVAAWMVTSQNIVLIVFGSILVFLSLNDIRLLLGKNITFKKRQASHIGKMTGAFIASVTAFLVNAVSIGGGWYLWLLPTAVLVPVIVYWQVKGGRVGNQVIR
jgi:uncharacterized membrane protein